MAKKEISRDYVIAAFARWSNDGRPTYEAMQNEIEAFINHKAQAREEQKTAPAKPTEAAVIAAERAWERRRAYYLDMQAAEKVYNLCKGTKYELPLEVVYLRDPQDVFRQGEITCRTAECVSILQFSEACKLKIGKSPESIKLYLTRIRRMFCEERGISYGIFEKIIENYPHSPKKGDIIVSSKDAGSDGGAG